MDLDDEEFIDEDEQTDSLGSDGTDILGEDDLDDEDLDEELDLSEDTGFIGKIKSKLKGNKASKASELSASEKKRKYLIQGVVVLAVLFLAYDHFTKEDEAVAPEPVATPAGTIKKAPTTAEGDGASSAPISETPVQEAPPTEEALPVEEPVVTEETPPVEEPVVSEETPAETPTDTTSLQDGASSGEDTFADSIDGEPDPSAASDDDLTDKILQDLEKQTKPQVRRIVKDYVNPPDYEYRGRGLVYNCAGKHWACIDGPSYNYCEDNISSVKYLKRKTECYPFNVYNTLKGCEAMQSRMVSSSAKTGFCNEN